MKKKLNNILLVDDDPVTNLVNKRLIQKLDCSDEITEVLNGEDALTYLTTADETGDFPNPNLIFLDINMPGMDGWEFLDTYKALPDDQRGGIILMMLTSSLSEDDQQLAIDKEVVSGFKTKPLTKETLEDTLKELFPDRF